MADGELKISLDDETARRLKEAADAAGRSVGDFARDVIADHLDYYSDNEEDRWAESLRRLEEYDRTGESYPAEQVLAEFRARVAARIANKA